MTAAPRLTMGAVMRPGQPAATIKNVGEYRVLRKVARLDVANTHGRVFGHEHKRHGLAHDVARADDHDVLSFDRNVFVFEQALHAIRRTRRKYVVLTDHEPAHVIKMEAVDVFLNADGAEQTCAPRGATAAAVVRECRVCADRD